MEVGVSITSLFSPENNLFHYNLETILRLVQCTKIHYKPATALLQQTKKVYYCNSCTFQQ